MDKSQGITILHGMDSFSREGPRLYTRSGASSVHGTRLYTRNGFAVCTSLFYFVLTVVYFVCSMCAGCLVQGLSTCIAG